MEDGDIPDPHSYSIFLFYSSFSMLVSAIIAIIMKDLYVTIYFILLFLTSINYWRRAEYGFRRNIDLCVVYIGIGLVLWQVCLLKSEFDRHVFASMFVCVFFFYMIEHIIVYLNSPKWVLFHMMIHLYVSLSCLFVIFN